MRYWLSAEKLIEKYYNSNDINDLSEFLSYFDSYIKKCSYNATCKAHNSGIWICYEDFYSNFYFKLWEIAEDFRNIHTSSLKNVIIRRFHFAEIETVRMYKKCFKIDNIPHINYISAQWDELPEFDIKDDAFLYTDNSIFLKESLLDLKVSFPKQYEIIILLFLGYSGKEINYILFGKSIYDSTSRKKIQRAKEKFKTILNN